MVMLMAGLRIQCCKLLLRDEDVFARNVKYFCKIWRRQHSYGLWEGKRTLSLSKDAGDGIFAEAEVRCLQVQNPASYDDYCGCGVLGP